MKKADLYELIKTLSSAEKKVFKERHVRKEDGNFIRLFNAIAAGEATNDEQVKKKFENEKFLSHLGKTKAYLYDALLQSLHLQIQPAYARLTILQKIQQAETLLSRKLISQAEDMYMSTLELAEQTEELEISLFIRSQLASLKTNLHQAALTQSREIEFQKKLNELISYRNLFVTVYNSYTQRGTKEWKDIDHYKLHPLLQRPKTLLSNPAERSFEIIHSLLHSVSRDYPKAAQSDLKVTELIAPISHASPINEKGYISALFNTGLNLYGSGKDTTHIIASLEKFQPTGLWAKSHRFVCLLRLKLNADSAGVSPARTKKLIAWIEEQLPLHFNELDEAELVKAHHSIAALYMKDQNYNRALDYLILITNSKFAREMRPITLRVAMLYQLIAHYELKNFDWLVTTLRNYRYFQKTNDSFYKIEKLTFDFLSESIKLKDEKSRQLQKKKLETALLQLSGKESGLVYLQSIGWVK